MNKRVVEMERYAIELAEQDILLRDVEKIIQPQLDIIADAIAEIYDILENINTEIRLDTSKDKKTIVCHRYPFYIPHHISINKVDDTINVKLFFSVDDGVME